MKFNMIQGHFELFMEIYDVKMAQNSLKIWQFLKNELWRGYTASNILLICLFWPVFPSFIYDRPSLKISGQ